MNSYWGAQGNDSERDRASRAVDQDLTPFQTGVKAIRGSDASRFQPRGPNMERQLDHLLADSNRGREEGGVAFVATPPKPMLLEKNQRRRTERSGLYNFWCFFHRSDFGLKLLTRKTRWNLSENPAAPLSKTTLLIGKLLPYYLVNLIQIG